MPSQIITPPDHIPSQGNILVINALENELSTLVLWFKTVSEEYNIHIYHSDMKDDLVWVVGVAREAEYVLSSKMDHNRVHARLQEVFITSPEKLQFFGPNTDYPDLIQFFLTKKDSAE